jgi:tripartite-type tricarboxylate transporter receptor subunit TctC
MLRIIASLLAIGLQAMLAGVLAADGDWPTRPVRIIVPFGAGSTPDAVARVLADAFQQELPGATFIVENKPGASGNTGTEAVARAEPDGSTIGVSIGGPMAINTLLFKDLRYDPARDLVAISQIVTQPSILVVNADLGIESVAGLVALLRRDATKLTYGSIGNGSLSHLAMEAILQTAGVEVVHLPMQGSPAAMTALLRNDVQVACLPAIAVTPHAASGRIRMLAVSTPQRAPSLPDVPTLKESGVDVEADAWNGLIGPAGLPKPIVERVHQLTVKALARPDVRAKLASQHMQAVGSTPAEFRALIDAEVGRWAAVIRASKVFRPH